jgi:hypothetical protein
MKQVLVTMIALVMMVGFTQADNVAAFNANTGTGEFGSLSSSTGISTLNSSSGSGVNPYGYFGQVAIDNFSRNPLMSGALTEGSYLQFSFDTDAATTVAFDAFFMDNDFIVTVNAGVSTFQMGIAYNNGSGSFSENITGIDPQDINTGIDISSFSDALADSTVQFRVAFYDDTRLNPWSALYMSNSTLNGLDNSAVVFSGTAGTVPEPATMSLLALGGIAMLRRRKK